MAQITAEHPAALPPAYNGEQEKERPQRVKEVEDTESQRRFRRLSHLVGYIPTLLVMGMLAGLGAYGHHSDWKVPKFSAIVGNGAVARDDWCEEHGVPESQCVECKADLLPRGSEYGWCKEHGVHNCPLCHPDVAQVKQTPSVLPNDLERAARAIAMDDRQRNNSVCKLHRRLLQFASLDAVREAGLDIGLVDRQPTQESVEGTGEVSYDPTRLASLSVRVPGTVWRVEKHVGDTVRTGDVLALVDAKEVGRAKMELIEALAEEELQRQALTRLERLSSGGIVAGRRAQEAEAAYAQARASVLSLQQALVNLGLPVQVEMLRGLAEDELVAKLRFLGLPEATAAKLDSRTATANLVPVRAPLDGVVVDRQVTAGEVVDTSQALFQVADMSTMWLMLNVPLEEADKVALGQTVRFLPDGSRREVGGKVTWIATTANERTRTVRVRAELPNADGRLRNETFGRGGVVLRDEPEAIVVPNEAVHWEGCCHVVFVRDKRFFDSDESFKVFHVRSVRLGARNEKLTEILAGALPGEVVATKGSDVLRAQLLKNNLGEGCCAVE
jgi:multidrug efflux pump subunit AcrA (membrane-fusion protein)